MVVQTIIDSGSAPEQAAFAFRISVAALCLCRLAKDFQEAHASGQHRAAALHSVRKRSAATPLVLYLLIDTVACMLVSEDEFVETRLVLVGLWAGRVMLAQAKAGGPRGDQTCLQDVDGPWTGRGTAAAATWIFRGDGTTSRREPVRGRPWTRSSERRTWIVCRRAPTTRRCSACLAAFARRRSDGTPRAGLR